MATLVLLPGMDGSDTLSAEFVAAMHLSDAPTVVSYPPDRARGYGELEAFVQDRLPTDRPYVLIAESFSGPIAIALAARNPPGLAALVLVCTFVRCPIRVPKQVARAALHLPIGPVSTAIGVRYALGSYSTPTLRTQIRQAVAHVSPATLRARLRAVVDVDVSDAMRQVRVPVLYLRAAGDRVISRSANEAVSRCCPSARVVEIDGPHFLLLAKPHECAVSVREFVAESGLTI